MRVVAAHENLDFDALGSMVLAGRLYPGSVLALVGGVEGVLREVLPLLEDRLDLVPASEIPLDRVREVVLVDNARPERLGPLAALVGRVPFLVYDHHPRTPGDVPAVGGRVAPVGATVSLLVPLLLERGLAVVNAEEGPFLYLLDPERLPPGKGYAYFAPERVFPNPPPGPTLGEEVEGR